jgi:putative membrane protein
MKKALLLTLSALTLVSGTIHAATTQVVVRPVSIGSLSIKEFDKINQRGATAVSEVRPTSGPISSADEKLMSELATASRIQLETSRVAASRALRPDVRAFAIAEVEEQLAMTKKLAEVAAAKGILLLSTESKALSKAAKLSKVPAQKFDAVYIEKTGVKGHEKFKKLAAKIEAKAQDTTLRQLVAAASPVILTHLQVAQAEAGVR